MGKGKNNKNSKKKVAQKREQERSRRIRDLTLITVIVLALGAGILSLVLSSSSSSDADTNRVAASAFRYDKQPVEGNPKAKVKIAELGDYKCPVCKRFKQEIYPQLKKDFLDTDKASLYFINNQFIGEDSVTAGIAGEAVYAQDKDKFWKFYNAIYDNQGDESQTWATPEYMVEMTKENVPGLDYKRLAKDIKERKYEDEVQADKEIADKAKVTGAPALFINGKPVDIKVIFDYPKLKKMIEKEGKRVQ
ncbi:Protein-disulfide isomerase [Marininema mesophilum]|uniref:Protein-disulfide isomerase n=1 Tax=Marininema mesophilum TaxID=1048340 RepID=A0A1H2YFH1_9BACL|nr:thioredoxin domain-containing protein [Marininema mesophilum]SDX03943.1 Protein-disulfide isomerase [Marininema mesophilum]